MVPDAVAWSVVATPALRALASVFDETVVLTTRTGVLSRVVAVVESTRPLRVGVRVGTSWPAHRTAGGLVLLAGLPDTAVRELYATPRPDWHEDPPPSVELLNTLDAIRHQGFALDVGLWERGVVSIAYRVRDADGATAAAVSLDLAQARFAPGLLRPMLAGLKHAARAVEADRTGPVAAAG